MAAGTKDSIGIAASIKKVYKLQAAMEYLMTYGWAILFIAIVIIALFSLGLFSGSPLGSTCRAQVGFQCGSPQFSHQTGTLSIQMGQETGADWVSANIMFIPQVIEQSSAIPQVFTPGNYVAIGAVQSGSVITLSGASAIPVAAPLGLNTPLNLGTNAAGEIWAQYTINGNAGFLYAEVATVSLKAT